VKILKQGPVIAIDGPAGTGKSSATHRLAEALHFIHIDTGALYRAVAFLSLEKSKLHEVENPSQFATEIAHTVHLEFRRFPKKNPSNRILANGRDLTDFIRTAEVSMLASRVSAIPEVRAALVGLQRRLGCEGKAILEGRDIGTVIFPDADVKFFLSASVDERAKRRLIELEASGADAPSFETVRNQIIERDHGDSTRSVAPLKKAADAIEVDTSTMTLDEVVKSMETTARIRLGLGK
jgi:cytidylate kinase